ncbi:hypothetical protein U9R90_00730 [Streptomyces sp. E11-3]
MESMGKKKPWLRRSFTPEFKAEIVEENRWLPEGVDILTASCSATVPA